VTHQHHHHSIDGALDRSAIWDQALDWLLSVERSPDDAALRARLSGGLSRGQAEQAAFARACRVWRLTGLAFRR
jgi:ferric-dicitrate binding protein FerR (iron transport regulator)